MFDRQAVKAGDGREGRVMECRFSGALRGFFWGGSRAGASRASSLLQEWGL